MFLISPFYSLYFVILTQLIKLSDLEFGDRFVQSFDTTKWILPRKGMKGILKGPYRPNITIHKISISRSWESTSLESYFRIYIYFSSKIKVALDELSREGHYFYKTWRGKDERWRVFATLVFFNFLLYRRNGKRVRVLCPKNQMFLPILYRES